MNTFCRLLDNSDKEYRKVRSVHANFLYSVLLFAILVLPFGLTADEHSDIPDEPQKTVEGQSQAQTPLAPQNVNKTTDSSNGGQQGFLHTVLIPVFGVLLLGILIFLIAIFRKNRDFRKQVDNRLVYLEQKGSSLSESAVDNRHSQTFEGRADYSKELLSDFKHLLETLIDENRNIQRSLESIANTLAEHRLYQTESYINSFVEHTTDSTDSQEITEHSQDSQDEHEEPLPQALQEFCNLYNSRREDQLRKEYQPSYRIRVVNTIERREDPNERPIFETNERGRFWALYIEDEERYAVVPICNLTLERSVYGPGGFSEVFECPNFDLRSRYKNLRVVKPGIFKPDATQNRWQLIEKGEIDLGYSE